MNQFDCPGVSTLWQEVVSRLESSVERELFSHDPAIVLKSVRALRQFVVASVMNKLVVTNSPVLRPRLLDALRHLKEWSTVHTDVCIALFGLANSLVRDCSSLSEDILNHPDLLQQFIDIILDEHTDVMVREADLLFLRSLFSAEDLGSVLSKSTVISAREKAGIQLFTEPILQLFINSLQSYVTQTMPNSSTDLIRESGTNGLVPPILTANARCWLIELLALLATSSVLARRLHRCGALLLCHRIIMFISCRHRSAAAIFASPSAGRTKAFCTRVGCKRIIEPANHLASRFALKLMVHVFFHLDEALQSFKEIYNEHDPIKLVACYTHLTGVIPQASLNVCYTSPAPHGQHDRRKRDTPSQESSTSSERRLSNTINDSNSSNHFTFPTCACVPLDHATFALIGLLRGLIYWRLTNQCSKSPSIEAIDQFGTHVTNSRGIGMVDDDIALLIIQPLTESCLQLEASRLMTWACHVLVLVLDKRNELHLWTIYTNSFVREVDNRVTSLLKAVQEASDYHSHIQFLEHLIPLVKLFACLASGQEMTRVMIGELTMCKSLVEFAMRIKFMGVEHQDLLLEFQHSICVLLHILSRSFSLHHTFFRQETLGNHLLKLITDNLQAACDGHMLSTKLVESASSVLINISLPMSPLRESMFDDLTKIFIKLASVDIPNSSTMDTRSNSAPNVNQLDKFAKNHSATLLHLNGIWGLANLLHGSPPNVCLGLFNKLVNEGTWLEILRLAVPIPTSPGGLSSSHMVVSNIKEQTTPTNSKTTNPLQSDTISSDSTETRTVYEQVNLVTQQQDSAAGSGNLGSSTSETNKQEPDIRVMLVFQTLMLLRNLLRDELVIDSVIKEHSWNINQFIISVLESDYSQPVKEQAILVLAHIANGRLARREVRRNEDLIEKLTLFMRSPNSYTKAAALTATYNLLGLRTESLDSCELLHAFGGQSKHVLLSHRRRLRSQHHRHELHRKSKPDSAGQSSSSSHAQPTRRDVANCMAQTALEEAEEENEDDEQDTVVEHFTSMENRESQSERPSNEPSGVIMDGSAAFSTEDTQDRGLFILRRRRFYRSWQPSPPPLTTAAAEGESFEPERRENQRIVDMSQGLVQPISSSTSPTLSSTSSTSSCIEGETSVTAELSLAHPTSTADACELSSTTCSEDELDEMSREIQHPQIVSVISPSLTVSERAPLASVEREDDADTQDALSRIHSLGPESENPSEQVHSDDRTETDLDSMICSETVETSEKKTTDQVGQTHSNTVPGASTSRPDNPSPSSHHSRKEWEAGFCQILLPFLQDIDSNYILRSTWDWLMLQASMDGKPLLLHTLFHAWRRLYTNIPTSSSSNTNPESGTQPNVTFDDFLKHIKESSQSASSASLLAALPRHRHRCRRQHRHHCHRLHLGRQTRHDSGERPQSPSALNPNPSDPLGPPTTSPDYSEQPE